MELCAVRKCYFILSLFALFLLGVELRAAETFQLLDGKTVNGEVLPTGANEQGVQLKVGEGRYEKVPWTNFSQPDLKKFQANPKLAPLVEPYIEVTQEERIKKTEVVIKPPTRLEKPPSRSFFGAMFTSSLGLFILAVLYAAIIYAGYEVAIFRAQPVPLVTGLSAIPFLGFFVPIIFLAMPTRLQAGTAEAQAAADEAAPGAPAAPPTSAAAYRPPPPGATPRPAAPEAVNPMQGDTTQAHSSLHIAHDEPAKPAAAKYPPTTTFQRGQFTFNRRFIETKFAGFFGVNRRDSDRDMLLIIKAVRGEYVGERISKITANDLNLEIKKGDASAEVVIPFVEIREIQLKHKDAP